MLKNVKKRQKFKNISYQWTDGPTDGPTDRWTDGPTDTVAYRVACTRLKTDFEHFENFEYFEHFDHFEHFEHFKHFGHFAHLEHFDYLGLLQSGFTNQLLARKISKKV